METKRLRSGLLGFKKRDLPEAIRPVRLVTSLSQADRFFDLYHHSIVLFTVLNRAFLL